MTVAQFRGLIPRFKSFSAENLRILLNKINIDVIFHNIQDIAVSFVLHQMRQSLHNIFRYLIIEG